MAYLTNRSFVVFGIVLILMVAAIACGSSEDPTATPRPAVTAAPQPTSIPAPTVDPMAPKYGGILIAALSQDPPNWDPMRGIAFSGGVANKLNGDGNLVKKCRFNVFVICPSLAESWETSSDASVWTFKIRDNAYWHDGTKFTAEDAKLWMEVSVNGFGDRNPSRFGGSIGPFQSVEVLDGNRLKVTLEGPRFVYIFDLADGINQIATPKHLMQQELDKGNVDVSPIEWDLVGVGPLKFDEHGVGSFFNVRRNDRYWEKDAQGRQLPFLDGIDHIIIKDRTAQMAAYRTGKLDLTGRISYLRMTPELVETFKKEMGDEFKLVPVPINQGGGHFRMNVLREPWTDIRVRKALALWIDRQAFVFAGGGPDFVQIAGLFPPGAAFAASDLANWPGYRADKTADRAEAKRLLTEAGFPDGFDAEFLCNSKWVDNCERYAAEMTAFGLKVKIATVDPTTYYSRILETSYDVAQGSGEPFWPGTLVVDKVLDYDGKVSALMKTMNESTSLEQYNQRAIDLERYILREEYLLITDTVGGAPMASRSYVHNLTPGLWADADDAEAWMDK